MSDVRLIDANIFKRFLQALCKAGAPYDEVIQLLDKEPTVYNVDKVTEAEVDLNILISKLLVPMEIENVCEEMSDAQWGLDEDGETWCIRNCGKTNSGKCPEMNCYKEWLKMKRKENNNGKL